MGRLNAAQMKELQEVARNVVLKWSTNDGRLLVNFLHPRSKLPLTRQRVYRDKDVVVGMVNRSQTGISKGHAYAAFLKDLERGHGEMEIWLSGEQYMKLIEKKPRD